MLLSIYFILQIYSVQTFLAKKATAYYSEQLKTKVEIEKISLDFFKTIVIEGLYVQDLHGDTLLNTRKLKVNIDQLDLKKHTILLNKVILEGGTGKLIKYRGERDFNYQFIVDALVPKKSKKDSTGGWDVKFGDVVLNDLNFIYRLERDTSKTTGINFSDIRASHIFSKISNIKIDKDTVSARIKDLKTIEKSGFLLSRLNADFKVSPKGMSFRNLSLRTPRTSINSSIDFSYDKFNDFTDNFIGKVNIKGTFSNSLLDMKDLAFFAPQLYGLEKSILISGKVNGTIDDIKGKNLNIKFGPSSYFAGNLDMKGLPDIESTFINLEVDKLVTNKKDLEKIPLPPFAAKKLLVLPGNFSLLGNIAVKGNFSGFINDFVAYGKFNTAMGGLSSDISMQTDTLTGKAFYSGKIKTNNFNVGRFLDIPYIQRINIDADVKGSGLKKDNIQATLTGIVHNVEFYGHDYENVNIEGNLAKNLFTGALNVKEEHIDMDFKGTVDFSKKLPELNFISSINHADLAALGFINYKGKTDLSTKLNMNVSGNRIDNLLGQINIENTVYTDSVRSYNFNSFDLNINEINSIKTLTVESDFAQVNVKGKFMVEEMISSMRDLVSNYIPALNERKISIKKFPKSQDFTFNILFKATDDITALFLPGIHISKNSEITGSYNSLAGYFQLSGNSSFLKLYGRSLFNLKVKTETGNSGMSLNVTADKFSLTDSLGLDRFKVSALAENNKVRLGINWENASKQLNKGEINADAIFEKSDKLSLDILPSTVAIADSTWNIKTENAILIDSTSINIRGLNINNNAQAFNINGNVSMDPKDQLLISFSNFNLSFLNLFLSQNGFTVKGISNGTSKISDVYHKIHFSSDLYFKGFGINTEMFGDGSVNSYWNDEQQSVNFKGSFSRGVVPNLQFNGFYIPAKKENNIDIDLAVQSLDMQFLKEYVKEYCSDFYGKISGNVNLKGTFEKPVMTGNAKVQAKKVRFNYLNTIYTFAADVIIEPNSFGVENVKVYDQNANTAIVTGKVYHNNFSKFQVDFDIAANKFMMLNTNEANNSLYYGKANMSGIVNFFGYLDNITIDATVKTERGTQFNIPLSSSSEISTNDFVRFIKKDTSRIDSADQAYKVNLKGIDLNFNIEITPEAELQLIFDQKIGDVIKGRGNGNLNLSINTLGKFNMYGDYNIENGDYLFTLQNIINKKFEIEYGSTIKWSGDPYDAIIDLVAVYRPRASLKPFFFGEQDPNGIYSKRYPVDVKLLMTNKLMNPDIAFDIYLPTVDETTRQTVERYINTEAELNKQVFSLIMLRSFATPADLEVASTNNNNAAGKDASKATASELVSNQLSNWLSQFSNDFDIGVNYTPGNELSNEELNVMLSKDFFNDRVNIEGNVGMSSNQNSTENTNNIVGDVNVEYKISEDGKLRVKAFNKANENTILKDNAPYTQGVGVFYREEFSTLQELYKRYMKRLRKKKE